mmetsp:Transcript_19354/g.21532  ORF Transcript_19354/g.21532 Transcript_19354/m.21532 type:complete len:196 (-) Transcript_19354:52-639(-)
MGTTQVKELDDPAIRQEPPLDEILPGLYLGDMWKAKYSAGILLKSGVTHVLPVGESMPRPFPEDFKYYPKRIEIDDSEVEDLLSHFDECIEWIDEALKDGKIYVHCAAGISRSATVVSAYVMKKQSISAAKAEEHVRSRREQIMPNKGFKKQLLLYEEWGYKVDKTSEEYKEYKAIKDEEKKNEVKVNYGVLFDS